MANISRNFEGADSCTETPSRLSLEAIEQPGWTVYLRMREEIGAYLLPF